MKNNVYIHCKKDLKWMVIIFTLTLLPLLFYGMYKNGYLLYKKDIISFWNIFKPVYLILISLIIELIRRVIFKIKFKYDFDLLSIIIIPLFMPYNTSYLIYSGSLIIFLVIYEFLNKKLYFNKNAFVITSIIIMNIVMKHITFLNPLEAQNIYVFDNFDLFFGRSIGGICSSNIFLGIIFFLINSSINNYKWSSSLISIGTYLLLALCFKENPNILLNSNLYLALIIVLPIDMYSPRKNNSLYIYSIIVGISTFIFTVYINVYYGVFIGILLSSLIYNIIAKPYIK